MRIATWNINGLRARMDFLKHWLRARQPDLVGLQEIKTADDKFPHAELEDEGYTALVHGQKAWNGVAILVHDSAAKVELTQAGLPDQEDLGARLVTATVGDLDFTTIYCPNGKHIEHDDFPRKLAWFEALTQHLRDQHDAGRPTVVCGDFNICPTPLDSWNEEVLHGKIFHTDEERRRFQHLLDWGLIDLFRQTQPDDPSFSWWDYRGGSFHKNEGLRIDFLLGTRAVLDRLESIQIDRDYRKKKDGLTPSDHAPMMADLK